MGAVCASVSSDLSRVRPKGARRCAAQRAVEGSKKPRGNPSVVLVETTGLVRRGATEQREQNGEEDGACGRGMQTNGAERRSVNAKRRRGDGGCGLREREQ